MRRRLLASTTLIALVGVLVLGVPLAFVEAHRERAELTNRLEREADAVAAAVDDRLEARRAIEPDTLRPLVRSGHEVVVRPLDGQATVRVGGPIEGGKVTVRSGGVGSARVIASAPRNELTEQIWHRWLLIGLLALGGIAAAVVLGAVQGRRLARPLEHLARTATLLGEGDFSARAGHSSVSEIDAVAVALDATAVRIAQFVAREREFTANAAHQLRTPLTALQLRLEELERAAAPEAREEAARAQREVDRLQATIDDLLAMARHGRAGEVARIDLSALARAHAERWRPLLDRAGRTLVVVGPDPVPALASRGAVGQALDVLLENSLGHGGGTVRIEIERRGARAVIAVSDEGEGVPEGDERRIFERGATGKGGSGLGLHLARSLAEAEGGRLRLASRVPPRFEIALPAEI